MTFRFAILSAVSTKQQATADKTSLEEQITQCRRVTERGWHETAGPYIVTGQSRNKYLNLRDAEMEIPAIHDLLEGGRRRPQRPHQRPRRKPIKRRSPSRQKRNPPRRDHAHPRHPRP